MKNLTLKSPIMILACLVIGFSGCNKQDSGEENCSPKIESPVAGKVFLGEGDAAEANVTVRLYADQDLFVGYNKIYAMIYELGTENVIADAHVSFEPHMTMPTMSHTAPFENPLLTQPEDGLYDGAVVFIMPSTDIGDWSIHVHVHNHHNGLEGGTEVNVTVAEANPARLASFVSDIDGKTVFLSMVTPYDAVVGSQPIEFMLHTQESMTSYPHVHGAMIEMEPFMPMMGHGSSNNVNPVHMHHGHYEGTVNFSMSGEWEVRFKITDHGMQTMTDQVVIDYNVNL